MFYSIQAVAPNFIIGTRSPFSVTDSRQQTFSIELDKGVGIHILKEKMFSKFFTSLVFVYKSMSLKHFHIEQLCPSIDSMIELVFVHYAIM